MDAEERNEDEGHRKGDRDEVRDSGEMAGKTAPNPELRNEHEALESVKDSRRRSDPASGLLAGGGASGRKQGVYSIPIVEGRLAAVLPTSVPAVLEDWYGIKIHPNTVRKRIIAGTLVGTPLWAHEGQCHRVLIPLNEIIASWGLEGIPVLDGPGAWFVRTKR